MPGSWPLKYCATNKFGVALHTNSESLIPVVPPLCIHAFIQSAARTTLRIMTDRAGTPHNPTTWWTWHV